MPMAGVALAAVVGIATTGAWYFGMLTVIIHSILTPPQPYMQLTTDTRGLF
jgi:hypothetical protein